jgi:predicted permease
MLALFACLFFGLSPALRVTANSPIRAIQSGGRSNTDSEERFALRRGLVVVQVALSLVLVIGALLFARSLQNLVNVDPGFRPQGIIVVDIDMRQTPVAPEGRRAMFDDVLTRVRAVPGVERVGETYIVPLSGSGWNQQLVVDGAKRQEIVFFNRVNAEFFTTMETRLIAGRTFGPEDRAGGVQTAVVNQTFVKQLFPNENPIGRRFRLDVGPGDPNPEYQIVGIVEDTKYRELREDTLPISYLAMSQETSFDPGMALVVRTSLPESSVTPTLTRAVREAAPNATIAYSTIRRYISDGLVIERMMTTLAGFFGGLALLIATIGLYGVLSYTVSRRRVEIGIRMALGADPGGVVRMVLGESSRLVIVGVVIGTALAVLTSRWASSLLFGLKPWDPLSIGVALAALGAVSLAAAWIPARRASRVEPTEALRSE